MKARNPQHGGWEQFSPHRLHQFSLKTKLNVDFYRRWMVAPNFEGESGFSIA